MRIAVTGSIATEHLMRFPGSFANQFPVDAPHTVALSFLVDTLDIRRGGAAATIAFGLGRLGGRPLLIGAVGPDFGEYRCWLSAHGVDTRFVYVSPTRHTARRLSITDDYHNQISAFHAGAMTEARDISLRPIAAGGLDLVVVAPNDPEAMLRHTAECRALGIPFAADPAQHLGVLDRTAAQSLVDGATFLFTNESDRELLLAATRWTAADVLARVGTWITTLGSRGVRVESAGMPIVSVGAVPDRGIADPTGVGEAFRAGFLSGLARHLPPVRSTQLGCQLATVVLESRGAQDYDLDPDMFLKRLDEAYGPAAAADAEPIMKAAREINEAHHIRGYN
jgi:adenosine kinase